MMVNPFLFVGNVGVFNCFVVLVTVALRGEGSESGGRLGKMGSGSIMDRETPSARRDSATALVFMLLGSTSTSLMMFSLTWKWLVTNLEAFVLSVMMATL